MLSSPLSTFFCVFSSLLLLPSGCTPPQPSTQPSRSEAPVPVSLAPVQRLPVQRSIDVVGSLFGDEDLTLSAKVPGRITSILKDVGDCLAPTDILAQLDPTDQTLAKSQKQAALDETLAKLGLSSIPAPDFDLASLPAVQRARTQAANLQSRYKRALELHSQTPALISDQDFADIKTTCDLSKNDLDLALLTARALIAQANTALSDINLASQRLADMTIRAPAAPDPSPTRFSVAARFTSVGEYVKEGTPLFRLVADNPVKLRAAVPERFIPLVKTNQQVTLTLESSPDTFTGTLTRISPQIDPANRTFLIEAIVPNPNRLLKPGAFVRASILTHTDPSALFVPPSAIVSFAGVKKIFTIKDNKAVEFQVETGQLRDNLIEITTPLPPLTQVVTTNAPKLAPGTPIAPRQSEQESGQKKK